MYELRICVLLYRSAACWVRVQRGLVLVFFLQMYPRRCIKEHDFKIKLKITRLSA